MHISTHAHLSGKTIYWTEQSWLLNEFKKSFNLGLAADLIFIREIKGL